MIYAAKWLAYFGHRDFSHLCLFGAQKDGAKQYLLHERHCVSIQAGVGHRVHFIEHFHHMHNSDCFERVRLVRLLQILFDNFDCPTFLFFCFFVVVVMPFIGLFTVKCDRFLTKN